MNKKRILKAIRNLKEQKKIHIAKIKSEKKNFAVIGYWEKENKKFDEGIKKLEKKLKEK